MGCVGLTAPQFDVRDKCLGVALQLLSRFRVARASAWSALTRACFQFAAGGSDLTLLKGDPRIDLIVQLVTRRLGRLGEIPVRCRDVPRFHSTICESHEQCGQRVALFASPARSRDRCLPSAAWRRRGRSPPQGRSVDRARKVERRDRSPAWCSSSIARLNRSWRSGCPALNKAPPSWPNAVAREPGSPRRSALATAASAWLTTPAKSPRFVHQSLSTSSISVINRSSSPASRSACCSIETANSKSSLRTIASTSRARALVRPSGCSSRSCSTERAGRREVTGAKMVLGRGDRSCPSCLVVVERGEPDRMLK